MSTSSNTIDSAAAAGSQASLIFRAAQRDRSVRAKTAESERRYSRALASLAGGVSTGLRRSARPYPLYFDRGKGSRIHDVDETSTSISRWVGGPDFGHAPEWSLKRSLRKRDVGSHTERNTNLNTKLRNA